MAAFMQIEGIDGESTDKQYDKWIVIESMRSGIHRSVKYGAREMERVRCRTTLDDVGVVRQLDKSSIKLQEACANGTFFDDVEIHFCTCVNSIQQPYLKYTLRNVMVTGYAFHGYTNVNMTTRPTEAITLDYDYAEWEYVPYNTETGKKERSVPVSYEPTPCPRGFDVYVRNRIGRARKFSFPSDHCPPCGSQELLRAHCWGLDIAEWIQPEGRRSLAAMVPLGVPFDRRKFQGCTECGLMWNEVPVDSSGLRAYSLRKAAFNRVSPNIDSSDLTM